jgi:hypothetical protein
MHRFVGRFGRTRSQSPGFERVDEVTGSEEFNLNEWFAGSH